MKCKPGDMAVVLTAFHQSNVGTFVNVVGLYDAAGGMNLGHGKPVWLVQSYAPLTWRTGKKLWRGNKGPVPDSALQPIRGMPVGRLQSDSLAMPTQLRKQIG
ncbi:MAG: hypothetical protein ACOYNZ_09540 [Rhodoferax sp.]